MPYPIKIRKKKKTKQKKQKNKTKPPTKNDVGKMYSTFLGIKNSIEIPVIGPSLAKLYVKFQF